MAAADGGKKSPDAKPFVTVGGLRLSEPVAAALLVVAVGVLTYGLLLPFLGFYWDDWFYLWIAKVRGGEGLRANIAEDRPLSGLVFALNQRLLGTSRLGWHLHALVLRTAGGLAVLWMGRALWAERRILTTALALLFLVYPGFTMQPIALCYQTYRLALDLGIVSLALTNAGYGDGTRRRQLVVRALAVLSCASYLFLMEAFIGLEAIRLACLYVLAGRGGGERSVFARVRWAVVQYLPYMAAVGAFLGWRLLVVRVVRQASNVSAVLSAHMADATSAILRFPVELWRDILESSLFGWTVATWNNLADVSPIMLVVCQLAGLTAAAAVAWYAWRLQQRGTDVEGGVVKPLFQIGALGVLVAPVLTLFAHRHIRLISLLDRYTLPVSLAAAFLAAAVLLLTQPRARGWLLAGLVGLSVSGHVAGADIYRRNFELQRQIWWQMFWRAPSVTSGTMLAFRNPRYDNNAASQQPNFEAANLMYYPSSPGAVLWGGLLNDDILHRLRTGETKYRETWSGGVSFDIDLGRLLVIAMPHDGACLRIIDGARGELPAVPDGMLEAGAAASRIELVQTGGDAQRLTDYLGPELPHGWCFLFQTAELARQRADWATVARLGDEARATKLVPVDATEWMVFIEGYLKMNREDDARAVAVAAALRQGAAVRNLLCHQWARSRDGAAGVSAELRATFETAVECTPSGSSTLPGDGARH